MKKKMVKHWFTAYLTSHYSKGKKLGLDLGSGKGNWNEFRKCECIGLDLPSTTERPRENRPEICGTAVCLPFKDDSFDFLYSYSVLSYVNDLDETLNEIYRVLKPNSEAVFIVVNPRGMALHKDVDWKNRLHQKILHQKLKEHGFNSIKNKNLKAWFYSTYYNFSSVYAYAIVRSQKGIDKD